MEEDKKLQILQEDCPTRKLNLNVPPLSTRRLPFSGDNQAATAFGSAMVAADRVPFSWERIPGEPKDTRDSEMSPLPAPRLPPGWWQPQLPSMDQEAESCTANECGGDDDIRLSGSISDACGRGGDHSERFSDAIDIFSLAESTEDMETDCGFREATVEEGAKSKSISRSSSVQLTEFPAGNSTRHNSGEYQWLSSSSNFMIQRFLPDAQALAEESITNNARIRTRMKTTKALPPSDSSASTTAFSGASSYSPKLGCGLGSFFPWRMKPKLCSVKSPVCDTIIGPSSRIISKTTARR